MQNVLQNRGIPHRNTGISFSLLPRVVPPAIALVMGVV